jgi:hypothetical protein
MEQFQKIFVLNIKSRPDRRDRMLLGSKVSNLEFEFLEGAEEVPLKAMPNGVDPNWSMGFRGAWRSHMDAMKRCVCMNIVTTRTNLRKDRG